MTEAPMERRDDVDPADRWEQELPAGGPQDDEEVPAPEASEHAVPEASEGDLAESAVEVPLDEDDEAR
ncbi:hypothetical protein [Thalassiella azotivora]